MVLLIKACNAGEQGECMSSFTQHKHMCNRSQSDLSFLKHVSSPTNNLSLSLITLARAPASQAPSARRRPASHSALGSLAHTSTAASTGPHPARLPAEAKREAPHIAHSQGHHSVEHGVGQVRLFAMDSPQPMSMPQEGSTLQVQAIAGVMPRCLHALGHKSQRTDMTESTALRVARACANAAHSCFAVTALYSWARRYSCNPFRNTSSAGAPSFAVSAWRTPNHVCKG